MHFRGRTTLAVASTIVVAVLVVSGLYLSGFLGPRTYIILATTTSTRDSGLLDYLLPVARDELGFEVRYVAVGTGLALDTARRGDADIVLVHSPSDEAEFMVQGHGACRSPVMFNEFVVAGPAGDPAGATNVSLAVDAFRRIAANESLFFSRGDRSGTHQMELRLWAEAGLDPGTFGDWYRSVGQGMATTLRIASELQGYVLTDEGTFRTVPGLDLAVVFRGDPLLLNQYSVIPVNAALHAGVDGAKAVAFARWLTTDTVQTRIADYQVGGFHLFTPDGEDRC